MGTKDYQKVVNINGQNLEDVKVKPWYNMYNTAVFLFSHNVANYHELLRYEGEGVYLGGIINIVDTGLAPKPITKFVLILDGSLFISLKNGTLYNNSINTDNTKMIPIYDNGSGTLIVKLIGELYFRTSMALWATQAVVTSVNYEGELSFGYNA